jgi:hypothetical protein
VPEKRPPADRAVDLSTRLSDLYARAAEGEDNLRALLGRGLTPDGVQLWFELPNYLLQGRRPRDVLAEDPEAVRDAAWDLVFGAG